MFVSAWQEDDTGVEKDINGKRFCKLRLFLDPIEEFLTAAEEGKLETIKELLKENPGLKNVIFFFFH